VLLEGSNNLLLCESALAHLSSFRLLQNAEDCNLEWSSFRGAGQGVHSPPGEVGGRSSDTAHASKGIHAIRYGPPEL